MNRGISTARGQIRRAIRTVCALFSAALVIVGSAPALARGTPVPVTVVAKANVVAQLSFFKVDDLDFGKIIAGTTAGTVVVSPTGARTATGGAKLASGGSVKPASFAGKGTLGQTITIVVNSNTSTLTRVGGTQTMTMDTFVIGSTPTAILTTTPLAFRIGGTAGIFKFPVGATLRVNANQAPGTYVGNFTLTMVYQ